MDEIQVGRYEEDNRSCYVYLGEARVKAVEVQPTESHHRLVDIVFEVPLEKERTAEFLLRLETAPDKVDELVRRLREAIANPKPHPWQHDLFAKAVTGMTPRERMEQYVDLEESQN